MKPCACPKVRASCTLALALCTLLACSDDSNESSSSEPWDGGTAPVLTQDGGLADARPTGADGSSDTQTALDGAVDGAFASDAAFGADAALNRDAAAQVESGKSDDIFGKQVPRSDSWWVENGRIYLRQNEVHLYGVNWFGLETEARALFGVQEAKRSVADLLSQVKSMGFNALRVPLSPDSIDPGVSSPEWTRRGEIDTGREHFEELAKAAKEAGLYMLWDIHTCSSTVGYRKTGPTDPACTNYGKQKWLENLKTLAVLAKSYAPYVLGIDLFNEPHGLSWPEWKALAEEGGRVVLGENPNILTFVEGVGSVGYNDADGVFWGENLTLAKQQPIALPASRLVYSPHVYGPSVYAQPYFALQTFPGNMPAIWDKHFGFLFAEPAPVVPGEFGGRYVDRDKTWQDAFVTYLLEKSKTRSFFYWSLNPNSGDTGGLLQDDWKSVNSAKLELLHRLMK